jgi:hypothetical protein
MLKPVLQNESPAFRVCIPGVSPPSLHSNCRGPRHLFFFPSHSLSSSSLPIRRPHPSLPACATSALSPAPVPSLQQPMTELAAISSARGAGTSSRRRPSTHAVSPLCSASNSSGGAAQAWRPQGRASGASICVVPVAGATAEAHGGALTFGRRPPRRRTAQIRLLLLLPRPTAAQIQRFLLLLLPDAATMLPRPDAAAAQILLSLLWILAWRSSTARLALAAVAAAVGEQLPDVLRRDLDGTELGVAGSGRRDGGSPGRWQPSQCAREPTVGRGCTKGCANRAGGLLCLHHRSLLSPCCIEGICRCTSPKLLETV